MMRSAPPASSMKRDRDRAPRHSVERLVRRSKAHHPHSKIPGPLSHPLATTASRATVQASAISALFAFSAVIQIRLTTKSHSTCRRTAKLSDRRCEVSSIVGDPTELQTHSERRAIAAVHWSALVRPRVLHLDNLSATMPQTVPITKSRTNPQRDTVPVRS